MKNLFSPVVLSLALASGNIAYAEINIMPTELVEFAALNDCQQVSDFYEKHPGTVNPPFVYGYVPNSGENTVEFWNSAVFWCKSIAGKKPYVLMFKFKNSEHELTKCPFRIEFDDVPGGLSIHKDRKTTLKGFVYQDNAKRSVGQQLPFSHNAIRIYYDGVETLVYCHKGEWLIRSRD